MQKLCKKNACLTDHLIAQGDYPTEGILIKLTIPPGTFQVFGKMCPRGRIVSDSQIFLSPWSCLEGTLSQASRRPSPDMQQLKQIYPQNNFFLWVMRINFAGELFSDRTFHLPRAWINLLPETTHLQFLFRVNRDFWLFSSVKMTIAGHRCQHINMRKTHRQRLGRDVSRSRPRSHRAWHGLHHNL